MSSSTKPRAERQRSLPGFEPPNWTQVPNRLFDELLPLARGTRQVKVLLMLTRLTTGWHRTWTGVCPLPTLARLTGLHPQHVATAVNDLFHAGLIDSRPAIAKSGQTSTEYRLRLTEQPPDLAQLSLTKTVSPSLTKTVRLAAPVPDQESPPKERTLKKYEEVAAAIDILHDRSRATMTRPKKTDERRDDGQRALPIPIAALLPDPNPAAARAWLSRPARGRRPARQPTPQRSQGP